MRIRFRFLSSKKEQRGALRAGLEHGDGALCRFVDSLPLGPSSSFPVLNSCSPPLFDRWVLQAPTRVVAQSGGDTVVVYSIAVDPLHLGARQGAVGSGSPHSPPRPARPSSPPPTAPKTQRSPVTRVGGSAAAQNDASSSPIPSPSSFEFVRVVGRLPHGRSGWSCFSVSENWGGKKLTLFST